MTNEKEKEIKIIFNTYNYLLDFIKTSKRQRQICNNITTPS